MKSAILGMAILTAATAAAQMVISAESGLVYHTEGRTFLNDRLLYQKFGRYPQMNEGDVFRTGRGRAEVLLNPDAFLRLGPRTSIRMVSDLLTDSRVELLSGRVVLEAEELHKETPVTLTYGDTTITFRKRGVYHLDTEPAGLRVYSGEAVVEAGGRPVTVGKGKLLMFDSTAAVQAFDRDETDGLDQWSNHRAEYLAAGNSLATRSARGGRWAGRPRIQRDEEAGAP